MAVAWRSRVGRPASVVVGALAREMATGTTATDAVAKLVDNPALLRLPGLGTVINVL